MAHSLVVSSSPASAFVSTVAMLLLWLECCPTSTNAYIPTMASHNASSGLGTGVLFQEESKTVRRQQDRWGCTCYDKSLESVSECSCMGMNLQKIPQDLPQGTERLTMVTVGISTLGRVGLKNYTELSDLILHDLPKFKSIEDGAFECLHHLRTIYISNAPVLQSLSSDTFRGISKSLKSLRIVNCGLVQIPDMSHLNFGEILTTVDLEGNRIARIAKKSIILRTAELLLGNNDLASVEEFAFQGSAIARLSLKGNAKLVDIHRDAFGGMAALRELDLSETNVVSIPTLGLETLEVLRIQNTHSLKVIPSVFNFKSLQEAWLTHPFHCCAFIFPSRHDPENYARARNNFLRFQEHCNNNSQNRAKREANDPEDELNLDSIGVFSDEIISSSEENHLLVHVNDEESFHFDHTVLPEREQSLGTFLNSGVDLPTKIHVISCGNLSIKSQKVKCFPKPDALNPCEDVMGSHWLRTSVWIVVSFTVFGNISVLVVILSSRSGVSVFKFLISNLAFADLCMGLYLMLIASIDVHSIGEYFNFAFDWQYGAGCKTAGFLTVFASNLSVYTLTVITIERWLTITYAIYLNKRIKLRTAVCIMIGGWLYSIGIALLPLFGFSNYSSTSICLPMETRDWYDISYLLGLLLSSGLAFIIIAISYSRIYYSLGKDTRQAEMTVAKKMILLVFTNFACWAPIAFFAFTAMAGFPLIDVAKSKILLVFFYPLNSCANPYLYAIITTQYRKDLFSLLAKCGLCVKRAQHYKISYSIPTVNNTVPLMSNTNSSSQNSYQRKKPQDFVAQDIATVAKSPPESVISREETEM